jgi:hypothetical protein
MEMQLWPPLEIVERAVKYFTAQLHFVKIIIFQIRRHRSCHHFAAQR